MKLRVKELHDIILCNKNNVPIFDEIEQKRKILENKLQTEVENINC